MKAAEQIYLELIDMPEDLVNEVLDFMGYLKTRYPDRIMRQAPMSDEEARRRLEYLRQVMEELGLPSHLAPRDLGEARSYLESVRLDVTGYKFDRDEANAR